MRISVPGGHRCVGGGSDNDGMPPATIDDDFGGRELDDTVWVPDYLPQWTEPARSRARYDLGHDGGASPGGLHLRIDADQPSWREADGPMRVSGIQTGTFSGRLGSETGTHRHRPDGLVVVTEQPTRRLWTPSAGDVSVRMSASGDPSCLTAVWLVGFEQSGPADCGEICIAELFGDAAGTVRLGIKAHHDPRLVDEMQDLPLTIDATEPHEYGVRWSAAGVEFRVDGAVVMTSRQRLSYELQLMVDLFEFPESAARRPQNYPKSARIHRVRGSSG
jgi:hypothetical protein